MSWTRIQGHERLIRSFEHIAHRQRLAHAYLFVGPEGVGKTLFARELAKTLLCEARGERFEACDRCQACILVEANTHPDFFQAARPEDKNEFPIEVMHEVLQSFRLKSARGQGKVALIQDADDFNDKSANAFLKTLEEPPRRSVIILLSTSTDRQMATILSRCQIIRFHPLPADVVRTILEWEGVEPGLRDKLIPLAGGSPGQALALADEKLWDFRRFLLEGLTKPKPDTAALAKNFSEFAEDAGKEASQQRRRAGLVLRLLIDFLGDCLAAAAGAEPRCADPADRSLLNTLISRTGPDKILRLLDRCLEAEVQIDRYIQLSLVLESLLDSFGQVLR